MNKSVLEIFNTKKFSSGTFIIWLLLGVIASVQSKIYGNFFQDDAFITFRYARNIASGIGFVFNPGEWVLGTTTPLYTLLLAFFFLIVRFDIVILSRIINLVCLWGSTWIIFEITRKNSGLLLSFLFSISFISFPLWKYTVGMESSLLVFLLLASVFFYSKWRKCLTGWMLAFSVLTRYEMIFLVLVIGMLDWIKTKKIPFWLLITGIIISAWIIVAVFLFGSPIPLSASVKIAAPRIPFLVGGAFYFYQFILDNPLFFINIVMLIIGLFEVIRNRNFHVEYFVILMFSLIYLFTSSLIAGSFPWYYAPLIPAFLILYVEGIEFLDFFFLNLFNKVKTIFPLTKLSIGVAIIVVLTQLTIWGKDHLIYRNNYLDHRFLPYQQIANWLLANVDPNQTVATYEIGFIGYFTNMKIIDLSGLVTPALFEWVGEGGESTLSHALDIFYPDYVILDITDTEKIRIIEKTNTYRFIRSFDQKYVLYSNKGED